MYARSLLSFDPSPPPATQAKPWQAENRLPLLTEPGGSVCLRACVLLHTRRAGTGPGGPAASARSRLEKAGKPGPAKATLEALERAKSRLGESRARQSRADPRFFGTHSQGGALFGLAVEGLGRPGPGTAGEGLLPHASSAGGGFGLEGDLAYEGGRRDAPLGGGGDGRGPAGFGLGQELSGALQEGGRGLGVPPPPLRPPPQPWGGGGGLDLPLRRGYGLGGEL